MSQQALATQVALAQYVQQVQQANQAQVNPLGEFTKSTKSVLKSLKSHQKSLKNHQKSLQTTKKPAQCEPGCSLQQASWQYAREHGNDAGQEVQAVVVHLHCFSAWLPLPL